MEMELGMTPRLVQKRLHLTDAEAEGFLRNIFNLSMEARRAEFLETVGTASPTWLEVPPLNFDGPVKW